MYPILFTIGNFAVQSYLVLYTISFIVMFVFAIKRAPHFGVAHDTMLDVAIYSGLSMLVGCRLWYGVLDREQFSGNWIALISPFHHGRIGWDGSASTGGVVLGIVVVYICILRNKRNALAIADAGILGFLLSDAIGRTGCFLTGCCFGKPTDSWLGVVFPPEGHYSPFPLGTPLWPTQLFSAALGLIGFVLVFWLERKYYFSGLTFATVIAYYAVDRFIVEQFRYYPPSQILATIGPLTINLNHPLLGGLLILSSVLWFRGRRRQH